MTDDAPAPAPAPAAAVGRPRIPPRLIPLALYVLGVIVFAAVAGKRLFHQSSDPHYVYQADAWLHGELAIAPPLKGDDWAKVETVVLDDGREVRGRRLSSRPFFKVAGGGEIKGPYGHILDGGPRALPQSHGSETAWKR